MMMMMRTWTTMRTETQMIHILDPIPIRPQVPDQGLDPGLHHDLPIADQNTIATGPGQNRNHNLNQNPNQNLNPNHHINPNQKVNIRLHLGQGGKQISKTPK